jgi:anti-sigma B factor antagonist
VSILEIEKKDGYLLVNVLERRIFLNVVDAFRDRLFSLIEEGHNRVILDLSKVNAINSSGLGVLILAKNRVEQQKGQLVICGLSSLMEEIFTRMHFDEFFTITPDLQTAVDMIQKTSDETGQD